MYAVGVLVKLFMFDVTLGPVNGSQGFGCSTLGSSSMALPSVNVPGYSSGLPSPLTSLSPYGAQQYGFRFGSPSFGNIKTGSMPMNVIN